MKTYALTLTTLLVMSLLLGQAPAPAPTSGPATTQPAAAPAAPGPGTFGIPSGAKVAIIRIEGLIYDFTTESLQRRVDRAVAQGASLIVIELDTPGGMVTSALDIASYIKGQIPVPTIAWINDQAYSAGILIASACDHIIMSPSSATGDCAPIVPGMNLPPTERAKALSPILAAFEDNARDNNYDYAMFHAMCELGVEVYMIENKATGQRRLVNQADYAIMVQGQPLTTTVPTTVDTTVTPTSSSGAPAPAPTSPSPLPPGIPGLPGSPQQQPGQQPAAAPSPTPAQLLAISPRVATDADRGQWTLVRQVHDGRTLLTVSQNKAMDIGLAKAIVRNDAELGRMLGAASVLRVDQSWSESLAGWLTSPIVRGVLVLALLLGAYVEFQTPGVGIAGAVAGVALVLLLGAPFLVGLSEWWHIVLFLLGFILLMVEIFVTPGFGILGVSGMVLMFVGLVLQVVPAGGNFSLPPPEMWTRLQQSVLWMIVGGIASLVGASLVTKYFGHIPGMNRLVLNSQQVAMTAGGVAVSNPVLEPVSGGEAVGHGRIAVGASGRVVSGLRPTGRAEFDGQIIDVISAGGWIDANRPVKVVEVHGNRIVVDVVEA